MTTIRESIIDAVGNGARTVSAIAAAAKLSPDCVSSNLSHLKRSGEVATTIDGFMLPAGKVMPCKVLYNAERDGALPPELVKELGEEARADSAVAARAIAARQATPDEQPAGNTAEVEIPRFTSKRQQQQAAKANGAGHEEDTSVVQVNRAPAALSTPTIGNSQTVEFDTPAAVGKESLQTATAVADPRARVLHFLDEYIEVIDSVGYDPIKDADTIKDLNEMVELRRWLESWGAWKASPASQQHSVLLYGINERGQVSIERKDDSGQRAVIEREDVLRLMQFLTLVRPVLGVA